MPGPSGRSRRRRRRGRARWPAAAMARRRSGRARSGRRRRGQRSRRRSTRAIAVGRIALDPLERLDGADEQRPPAGRRARSRCSGSRTSRRQGTRRRCPAGPNMTALRAVGPKRACEARSSSPDVRLELDDPADAAARRRRRGPGGRRAGRGRLEAWEREESAIDDAQPTGSVLRWASGMNRPVSAKNPGMSVSRKSVGGPGRRARSGARAGTAAPRDRRDARDPEERVEDDQRRRRRSGALDHAEEPADHLVREAGLLEQRLVLVEALDHEGEGDVAATKTVAERRS